jgi:hypothetical protein
VRQWSLKRGTVTVLERTPNEDPCTLKGVGVCVWRVLAAERDRVGNGQLKSVK